MSRCLFPDGMENTCTILYCDFKNVLYICRILKSGCGEMVDTLVSGASASRRVGSTPIIRTALNQEGDCHLPDFVSISVLSPDFQILMPFALVK